MTLQESEMKTSRRAALRLLAASPAAALLTNGTASAAHAFESRFAAPATLWRRPELAPDARKLTFQRPASRECFSGVYFAEGAYHREALKEIDWRLRDITRDECAPIDPKLLDLLAKIQDACGGRELVVTSGYRTLHTNERLRARGAAKRSMHLMGQAVDFYCPGFSVSRLSRLAAREQAGGVGIYRRRGFVHVDTGPVRYWKG